MTGQFCAYFFHFLLFSLVFTSKSFVFRDDDAAERRLAALKVKDESDDGEGSGFSDDEPVAPAPKNKLAALMLVRDLLLSEIVSFCSLTMMRTMISPMRRSPTTKHQRRQRQRRRRRRQRRQNRRQPTMMMKPRPQPAKTRRRAPRRERRFVVLFMETSQSRVRKKPRMTTLTHFSQTSRQLPRRRERRKPPRWKRRP